MAPMSMEAVKQSAGRSNFGAHNARSGSSPKEQVVNPDGKWMGRSVGAVHIHLRPYQKEAKKEILKSWSDPERGNRVLLCLPTAAGKTIVFANVIKEVIKRKRNRVLILAHRTELLTQAADKLKMACQIESFFEHGSSTANGLDPAPQVVIASIQGLSRDKRLESFPSDFFTHIIIDEAHHCLAPTYRKVINYFEDAKLLGVTATPNRQDNRTLAEIFDGIAYEYSIAEAIRDFSFFNLCNIFYLIHFQVIV